MKYRLSEQYLRMRRNGPRRAVIMLTVVMVIMEALTFVGPAPHPDPEDAIGPFVVTLLVVIAIGVIQVRRMRRATADLEQISIHLSNDGIVSDTRTGQNLLRYEAIQSVTTYKPWFKEEIRLVMLKNDDGESGIPGLENAAHFVDGLRQKLPKAKFFEKRSIYV